MEEPRPMWVVFPDLGADDVHNQGAVDSYIEYIWLPYWRLLDEGQKAVYLDRHDADDDWRRNIADRYEWEGIDENGDPIWTSPLWLRRSGRPS